MKTEPKFEKGNLVDGLDSIERYLGLKEGSSAFLNEYCMSEASFPDLSEPSTWLLGDTWTSMYPLPLASKNAALLTLNVPQSLTWYLECLSIIPKGANIIEACKYEEITDRYYPNGSVIGQLNKGQNSASDLKDRTIIPSFVTSEMQKLAKNVGGETLLEPSASINFNSKSFLRKVSAEEGFSMPPGIIIEANDNTSDGISKFNKLGGDLNLSTKKAWLKFSTAAGGGTYPLNQIVKDDIEEWVYNFTKDASRCYKTEAMSENINSFDKMPAFMRRDLVLEFDINSLSNTEVIGNFGMQAVIGDDGVTYIGSTKQLTEDGDYLGGETLLKEDKYIEEAMLPEAKKVFEAYWKLGYRGVMGVDALMTKRDDNLKAYVLEANCRITAATPLLGVVQKLQVAEGRDDICGRLSTFTMSVKNQSTEGSMRDIFNALGDDLYKSGAKSGIVPFMADVFPCRDDMSKTKVRCVVIGETPDDISDLQQKTNNRLSNNL